MFSKLKSKPHDAFTDAISLHGWNRSVWHVFKYFIRWPKAHHRILHVLYQKSETNFCVWIMFCISKGIAGGYHTVSAQIRKGQLKGQTKWRTLWFTEPSVLSFDLLRKFQTHCDSSRKKQFIFILRAWICQCHNPGHHFINPRQSKGQRSCHRHLSVSQPRTPFYQSQAK